MGSRSLRRIEGRLGNDRIKWGGNNGRAVWGILSLRFVYSSFIFKPLPS